MDDLALNGDIAGLEVTLSTAAAAQVAKLCQKESRENQVLRVMVEGGGCSGFQYIFELVDAPDDEDAVFQTDGVRLAVDPISLPLLAGSTVDYVVSLVGSSFQIDNPNAASSCGCGTSFSIG